MLIYLIRHGEKEKFKENPPLTKLGLKQVQKTAEYFKNIKVKKIYSSPLIRAMQTSEVISKYLKLDFETNDLLKERFNWGDIENQTFSEFIDIWEKSSLIRNWQPPEGFSSNEAGERLQKFINSINEELNSKIIVVSHGGIIADFLRNSFEDKALNEVFPNFSEYYENSISVCSITILKRKNNNYKVISIGENKHLK